jgi:hypothetical protein
MQRQEIFGAKLALILDALGVTGARKEALFLAFMALGG